jgi:hypothetical protein
MMISTTIRRGASLPRIALPLALILLAFLIQEAQAPVIKTTLKSLDAGIFTRENSLAKVEPEPKPAPAPTPAPTLPDNNILQIKIESHDDANGAYSNSIPQVIKKYGTSEDTIQHLLRGEHHNGFSGEIFLGTPPQPFQVLFTTSAYGLWIYKDTPCNAPICLVCCWKKKFVSSNSKSYISKESNPFSIFYNLTSSINGTLGIFFSCEMLSSGCLDRFWETGPKFHFRGSNQFFWKGHREFSIRRSF